MTACYFHDKLGFPGCDFSDRPDGRPDPAHWIPQQRLRAAGVEDLWHPASWAHVCRRHHTLFDQKTIRLTEEQYPREFRAWAALQGFWFAGPREGWRYAKGEMTA